MLVVATFGLVVNLVSMRLLKAGSGESLNVKGAYLEVWADMLGSIGVILGVLVATAISLPLGQSTWVILLAILIAMLVAWALKMTAGREPSFTPLAPWVTLRARMSRPW